MNCYQLRLTTDRSETWSTCTVRPSQVGESEGSEKGKQKWSSKRAIPPTSAQCLPLEIIVTRSLILSLRPTSYMIRPVDFNLDLDLDLDLDPEILCVLAAKRRTI